MKNLLSVLFTLICISGCAFNTVFFPSDNRPDADISVDYTISSVPVNEVDTVQLFKFPASDHALGNIMVFQGSGNKVRNWYKVVKPLHDAGYHIFMMEYPGFGSTPGVPTHVGVAQAATAVIKHLNTACLLADMPLLALGQSYGGQLAIYTAAQGGLIDALIVEGTFTSFSEEAAWSAPAFIGPLVRAIFDEPYRAEQLITSVDVPLLIIHSKDDQRVPYSMGQTLYNAARSMNKQLWPINGKHLAGLSEHTDDYLNKIDVLMRNLKHPPRCP